MKKIGNVMTFKKYILTLLLLFAAFIVKAQDANSVTFKVLVNKSKLGINERLRVDFVMNRDGDNFSPPNFEGFQVIMGPSQSISNSWINGVRSYSKTYSYILKPTSRGIFTIKQASILINGKTYKSLSKKIEVTAAVDKPSDQMTADDVANEGLHLVAEVSKTNPYLNEPISVVYKLYINPSVNISNYSPLDNPKYNYFWSHDIPVTRITTKSTTYKGQPYFYAVLKRVVLYPQKTGKLEIEPLSLEVTVDVPTNRRNFFRGRIYSQVNTTVSTNKQTITVKDLPLEGKPANFNGAVGDFNFSVTTSKTKLNASESLQARVEVSGKGNLILFKLPKPNLPNSLEVYEPEYHEKVRTVHSGMEGKVSNHYTIVPSFKGKYPILSISFSYFNPKTESYKTLKSDEIIVNVIEGPSNGERTNYGYLGNTKQSIVSSGNSFNFIKTTPNLKKIGVPYFIESTSFYLGLLLPLLLIPIAIFWGKKREAIASDIAGNKIRRANRLARKYLSTTKKALGNKEQFYIALEKGLHNYLKAKLKIETSEFSKDKITILLSEKQVDDTLKDSFVNLLKNCEMARYSQFSVVQMQQDYDKASEVISYLDKQL